ncbi:MAG TPA: hypothetical protein VGS15_11125 [Candidatus Acidoferrales bacterium]|nr:hypothetical protein [Candidatus Acidoferrales bacterium]
MNQGENGGGAADAESESEHRGGGEDRRQPELAQSVAKVAKKASNGAPLSSIGGADCVVNGDTGIRLAKFILVSRASNNSRCRNSTHEGPSPVDVSTAWTMLGAIKTWSGDMKVYFKTLVLILFALQLGVPVWSQSANNPSQQENNAATPLPAVLIISENTRDMSCWNRSGEFVGSRLLRSPVLISGDGLRRAMVEVEATGYRPKDPATYAGSLCENHSRLFFAGPQDKSLKIVYQLSPDSSEGNSLKLVDWSPDGTRLLVERGEWLYESEGDYTDFVVFDSRTGSTAEPNIEAALEARFGKGCSSDNSISGFTPKGDVVVTVSPISEPVAVMNGAKSCVSRKTPVAISIQNDRTPAISLLPNGFKLASYGKFENTAADKQ